MIHCDVDQMMMTEEILSWLKKLMMIFECPHCGDVCMESHVMMNVLQTLEANPGRGMRHSTDQSDITKRSFALTNLAWSLTTAPPTRNRISDTPIPSKRTDG